MSTAPSVCECRFCGETFEPSGIKNHETYCDGNPMKGVPVEKQKEHGIGHFADEPDADDAGGVEEEANRVATREPAAGDADPDQRATTDGGASLPPRESLPEGDKSSSPGGSVSEVPDRCPSCSSENTMPAYEARESFAQELGGIPDGLRATLDAGERYCNGCFSVYGGRYDEPWPLKGR